MRIENISLSKLSKNTELLSTPTVVVLSDVGFKKGKWLSRFPKALGERVGAALARSKEPMKAGSRIHVSGWTKDEEDFWVALLPENKETYFLLGFARDTLKGAIQPEATGLRLVFACDAATAESAGDVFGAALSARIFLMPVFGKREKEQKAFALKSVEIASESRKCLQAFNYGYATAEGTNLARYLATLPPNFLNPADYGRRIRQICKQNAISVRFHSKEELRKMGAGAFTAVDQGDPSSAGGIYELSHTPRGKAKKTIHFAGKGICFDTGGYDIKISGGMATMKGDMQGSAVALASMVTAVKLGLPYRMKSFLAVTENHVSPKAYKADDVVTALNGLSIEVVNTDAEGRMVLADTLTLASRGKPNCLIDFATLTGSAIRAIGTRYSCGFTNREKLHDAIKLAGIRSGERIWTFPTDSSYFKALESKVADTLQCVKGSPDHILAACFLSRFIEEDTAWVHIDLSAAENEDGIGHVDSKFTGFGVRWALEFIKSA